MEKVKFLFKNVGFLTISQFGVKFLNFFLIPLYTAVLSTAEYGTYDIASTTISLLLPFLMLNIQESTLRSAMEKNNDQTQVLTISLRYFIRAVLYAGALLGINFIFHISPLLKNYSLLILIMFAAQAFNSIMTSFARGMEGFFHISVSFVLSAFTIIMVNILTLLVFHLGLIGYFLANIAGMIVQSIYLFIRLHSWKYVVFNVSNPELTRAMLYYSVPMILNSTAWWINGALDRYLIVGFCGIAANGIYSVASKIPSILDSFTGIFNQAWTLSAVKEFDKDDTDGFFTNMFNSYNLAVMSVCSIIILMSRVLAGILYSNEFYIAWKYVPFLTISALFGALSGYIGGFFAAVKNSKIYAYSSVLGAGVNIILNFVMVPVWGPLGAAVATSVGYTTVFFFRVITSRKYIKLHVHWLKDLLCYFLLFLQSILLLQFPENSFTVYFLEMLCFGSILLLQRTVVISLIYKAVQMLHGLKRRKL